VSHKAAGSTRKGGVVDDPEPDQTKTDGLTHDILDFVVDADGVVLAGPPELHPLVRLAVARRDELIGPHKYGYSIDLGVFHATVRPIRDPNRIWFVVQLAPRALGHSTHLTKRQFEVARLAALGRRNHEIGIALECSVNTVRAHLRAVYERLSVTNRVELLKALADR